MKFLEKKLSKKNDKNNFMKNKYKYKDMKSKSFGNYKNGILEISKKDLRKMKSS
jgi:hypothetical protein